ncbi:Heat shock 70 kDa protein 12A-like protein [Hapsidospora chrysogenum ATCC 11550]|uniref:Heat shock 70 kDa protein 12A-like protein n=1 Tax=Hapsidospora chrysogenum (strain ATCC 11550 / CBS 779.69 / DSM 880 / IAM 14645 / JCM 23072 / IMI 49137) TaxID=857340 RepID=A0A086SXB0_HAPC1|nr:Heat shock 70 kDa protein 12A-like protein [Hapsidospora chrysogenum ATCC 11550]
MSLNLPLRTTPTNTSTSTSSTAPSRRNQESRSLFTGYTPPSSTEAINGPVREPPRELPPVSDRLIVGVDFGTTFSGVAAVYTSTPDDIEIIKTWPGGNGITSDKVPTEIAYDYPASAPSGSEPTVKWGFQFKPEESRLRCIKLFLDRSQKLPFYVSPLDTAAQLKRFNKNVVDAVSDYLTQIYKHTMDTLTRRYGESFMGSTRVEFVLTCPAVWSDAAKNTTLQAAERAGMGSRSEIQMISEPEAAAVYTLKAIQPNHLNVGDNFIVCDAGGGTVDLIAYKIMSLKPLRVEESAVGTGGLCGSAFLNYRFEEHVRNRLGQARFDEMKQKKSKTWQMGLRYFEEFVKRNFNEDEHQEVNIPFPGLPDDEEVGLDCGFLVMTAEQIKDIFEPVVKEVTDLVQGQVEGLRAKGGVVSGIVLVGGFGQSDYLYRRLKAHFTSAAPPPYSERPTHANATTIQETGSIEVMQPVYAWTAVVRGAVLRGLEGNMVISRKSRMHYGTSYATVYDEEKHSVSERYWSPLWERWMVSDRMQWHIAKGESLSPVSPIAFHYTRNFRPGQSLIVTDDLIACDADEPPAAYTRDLIHVCTLTTDLNAVPRSLFTRLTTTRGVEFDNLDFTLEMIVDSAGLGFELKVDGVRYGRVEAEFH